MRSSEEQLFDDLSRSRPIGRQWVREQIVSGPFRECTPLCTIDTAVGGATLRLGSERCPKTLIFAIAVLVVAAAAGSVAAAAGFGIGSVLTPLLALRVDTKTAVAAVSVPHAIGTVIRFWRMRADLNRGVLWRFGLTSAAGGLAGALLDAWASSPALATVFGVLLVFASGTQLTGLAAAIIVFS